MLNCPSSTTPDRRVLKLAMLPTPSSMAQTVSCFRVKLLRDHTPSRLVSTLLMNKFVFSSTLVHSSHDGGDLFARRGLNLLPPSV